SWLSAQGATVAVASPDFDWRRHYLDYQTVLASRTSGGQPLEQRQALAKTLRESGDDAAAAVADGILLSAIDYSMLLDARERYRATYRRFFRDWDVLLTP
ncbi:hypothetical protein M2T37_27335, partial [Klebsiella pneumoniae]|uniref:hypothetical protein n=1 Tax=Klebsiella pneumoniae TaxID=573 RepID=UPI00200EDE11